MQDDNLMKKIFFNNFMKMYNTNSFFASFIAKACGFILLVQ